MEIVLIAALIVVAAAGLYVALTFNKRSRQTAAPLVDAAVSEIRDQLRATSDELRGQLRAITEELRRDREEHRLDERKIQGRLDYADSRISNMSAQFLAELAAIKHRGEQVGAQQDQLSGNLQLLAAQAGGELPSSAVPGRALRRAAPVLGGPRLSAVRSRPRGRYRDRALRRGTTARTAR
jgi:hypothetical protein